jgi:hypothetical protein
LLPQELNDIWSKVPKIPDVASREERIDVDSFVQVYRDIDDLFYDEDDDDEETTGIERTVATTELNTLETREEDDENTSTLVFTDKKLEEDELRSIFWSMAGTAADGLISKDMLQGWDEVQKLLEEGLLGQDELDDLWIKTKKSSSDMDKLDVDGFLSLNVALDGLFDLGDDDDDDDDNERETINSSMGIAQMVQGTDLSPLELFSALASSGGADGTATIVTLEDLKRWEELQEMLSDGDLLASELETLLAKSSGRSSGGVGRVELDQNGFVALYWAIDNLFEEQDDDGKDGEGRPAVALAVDMDTAATSSSKTKATLLKALEVLSLDAQDEGRLPCGLESTDREQREMLALVNALEAEVGSNLIRRMRGEVGLTDLAGHWELLYSSSGAMKFNKGLSGLGGSFPNGRFAGLLQKLDSSRFMTDVEYVERISVNPESASFDVRVSGVWDLRQSVSLFTGEPSIVLQVEPDRVEYGPTSTRADHWKSLGPLNMLDVAYLDNDLRIMRGNTSLDTIFIFRRLD